MINFNEFFVLGLCIQPVTATLQELLHDSEKMSGREVYFPRKLHQALRPWTFDYDLTFDTSGLHTHTLWLQERFFTWIISWISSPTSGPLTSKFSVLPEWNWKGGKVAMNADGTAESIWWVSWRVNLPLVPRNSANTYNAKIQTKQHFEKSSLISFTSFSQEMILSSELYEMFHSIIELRILKSSKPWSSQFNMNAISAIACRTGLEITPVRSSGTSSFSCWASNFVFLLAPRARAQAGCLPIKFLIRILRRKDKF